MSLTSDETDPVVREALECLPCGISVIDPELGPTLHNSLSRQRFPHLYDAYEKFGAQSYRDAMVHSIRMLRPSITEAEIERFADDYVRFADEGATYDTKTPDGRVMQVQYRPMTSGRRVAISVDVTEDRQRERDLRRAQEQAVAASNSKSAFLANMSHEIRTPLNGILGMAQVLEMGNLSEEQREQVATILDSGRNLMALLNDVLDLSKIEAGKLAIVHADTDLAHTMLRMYRLWKPKAEESGVEFNLSLDADLPQVLNFDAVRVRQCVSNLVSNAIKFTRQGRVEVNVSARTLPDGQNIVRIRVTDTGVGMTKEVCDQLFQPFVQADESISRRYGGTGLGLSIVRKLAEIMGGAVDVRSEPGRGSEFTFSFLAGQATHHHRVVAEGTPAGDGDLRTGLKQQGLRILLVDDQPINRQVASLFLKPFNMRIVEATNGEEALEALARETFDIVLLDVHMPVKDGVRTIQDIRAADAVWNNVPVIALTADAMSGDKEKFLSLGMDGYISKPIAERELITEISRLKSIPTDILADVRRTKMAA